MVPSSAQDFTRQEGLIGVSVRRLLLNQETSNTLRSFFVHKYERDVKDYAPAKPCQSSATVEDWQRSIEAEGAAAEMHAETIE